jgi:hypothetical protein
MQTTLEQRIQAFVQLGKVLGALANNSEWPGFELGLTQEEYDSALQVVQNQVPYNGWFTPDNVSLALNNWSNALDEDNLKAWVSEYDLSNVEMQTVAIICAGNIPMVGFHDILCVLISGHKAMIKLSSDDARLIPLALYLIMKWQPAMKEQIQWAEGKLEKFDRIIATGSDNTSRYFHAYFDKYPNIIRQTRTSVAILNGTESAEELHALGRDIFDYFGLGCRNVCKVYFPEGYDINTLIAALLPFQEMAKHNKYANNYDYNKAVWLLNREDLLENGFMLFKQDKGIIAPTGSLFYEYYREKNELLSELAQLQDRIQCIVGHGHIPFGQAQCPSLRDYADNIDVMRFLIS